MDENSSSTSSKQWVSLVVAHELAHQWFGNIVTMEWWTHLWLNEGFATWMEYLATNIQFPNWNIWTQFVYQDMTSALKLDSLESSHPIEVEVSNPTEIDEIFDEISYSKGSSVIRMLYAYLGENDFKQGLREYLNKHQFSNATTEDLWNSLATASKKPVKQMMDTWTKQTGYPVIIITQKDDQTIHLEQKRFFSFGVKENLDSLWYVPIQIISDSCSIENSSIHLFHEKSTNLELPPYKDWFKGKEKIILFEK